MPKLSLLPALAAACCAGALLAAPAAGAAPCPSADIQADQQSLGQLEDSVLCLINGERADAGIDPVRPESQLRQAASQHANEMLSGGYFAHTSPSGETFIDRIGATGYMQGARSWLVGENLVWGSAQLGTPASMVEAWVDSPPHRANLLRSQFREIGLAAVRGTPFEAGNETGVIVSSEYGYRDGGRSKKDSRKARRARARKARARARHR